MNVSRFVSCQDEYSLVVRDIEKDLLPAAQGIQRLLPFFPLASGLPHRKIPARQCRTRRHPFRQEPGACATACYAAQTKTSSKTARRSRRRAAHHAGAGVPWLAIAAAGVGASCRRDGSSRSEANVKAIEWHAERREIAEIDGDYEGVVQQNRISSKTNWVLVERACL